MKKTSIADIISPVMIGPSSSHTAGAIRLGLLARNVYGENPQKVTFKLYNSYAQTGKGHGTEKGLLAGVLGYAIDDRRIKDIFNENINIKYDFEYYQDMSKHPDSVIFVFESYKRKMVIYGESVGAGEIRIRTVDGFSVRLDGEMNTLLLVYKDIPGMISKITGLIQPVNIATLYCDRAEKGQDASMYICLDGDLSKEKVKEVENLDNVYFVSYIEKL